MIIELRSIEYLLYDQAVMHGEFPFLIPRPGSNLSSTRVCERLGFTGPCEIGNIK